MSNNKITFDEFIRRAQLIHINEDGSQKYMYFPSELCPNYQGIEYTEINGIKYTAITNYYEIYCINCQETFTINGNKFLNQSQGCSRCAGNKPSNKENFINDSHNINKCSSHYDKNGNYLYAYEKTVFVNMNTLITITCIKCKRHFEQRPADHKNGQGCKHSINTAERFEQKLIKIHGAGAFIFDENEYKGQKTPIKFTCQNKDCKIKNENYEFKMTPADILKKKCPKCPNKARKDYEDFIKAAEKIDTHKDDDGKHKYDYSKINAKNYKNLNIPIPITCLKCKIDFLQKPDHHLRDSGCPTCNGNKKLTTEEFIEKSKLNRKNQYPDGTPRYNYDDTKYINGATKVNIKCLECSEIFSILPDAHFNKGYGCNMECGKRKAITVDDVIKRSETIHGAGKFTYKDLKDKLGNKVNLKLNNKTKLNVKCNDCGHEFNPRIIDHLGKDKTGCAQCSGRLHLTAKQFVEKVKLIHGDKFDYSGVKEFKNLCQQIDIKCNTCKREFKQRAQEHLDGYGCSECSGNLKLTVESFKEKAIKKHGDKFDYSEVKEIINGKTNVIIKCKAKGHTFEQPPSKHIFGYGCNQCSSQYSQVSIRWLTHLENHFGIEIKHAENSGEYEIKSGRKKFKADGYYEFNEKNKVIFEFHGCYFHGCIICHPIQTKINTLCKKTFKKLNKDTETKKQDVIARGYKYVAIWEHEFDDLMDHPEKMQGYLEELEKNLELDDESKEKSDSNNESDNDGYQEADVPIASSSNC